MKGGGGEYIDLQYLIDLFIEMAGKIDLSYGETRWKTTDSKKAKMKRKVGFGGIWSQNLNRRKNIA